MMWAVIYAATVFALAYAIPKLFIISAQVRMLERELEGLAKKEAEKSEMDWASAAAETFSTGGYQ